MTASVHLANVATPSLMEVFSALDTISSSAMDLRLVHHSIITVLHSAPQSSVDAIVSALEGTLFDVASPLNSLHVLQENASTITLELARELQQSSSLTLPASTSSGSSTLVSTAWVNLTAHMTVSPSDVSVTPREALLDHVAHNCEEQSLLLLVIHVTSADTSLQVLHCACEPQP